jgi:predicted enzyme related to lactoylglutathione lyase
MADAPKPGTIAWTDLTVPDAERVRDFYAAVTGWTPSPVEMKGYEDFAMTPPGGDAPVAGICHARGPNAALPAQWLPYIVVPDLATAMATCVAQGGSILVPGEGRPFAVCRDPAGAAFALYESH